MNTATIIGIISIAIGAVCVASALRRLHVQETDVRPRRPGDRRLRDADPHPGLPGCVLRHIAGIIPTLAGMTTTTMPRRLAAIALTGAGALLLTACSGSDDNAGPEQPCQVASYTEDAQEQLDDEGVSAEEVAAVVAETCAGGGDKEWDEEGTGTSSTTVWRSGCRPTGW
ncbi:hypothetical protein QP028_08140 [Corynebacterium suedekumii]|nr:hypothetical protein QP028_08140 [Corynebacterium suedekumii]